MKEIILSVFKTSEERLKNPFIGTFIISFIALNWRAISVFLLSSQAIENRINFIVNNYFNIWNTLLIPIIISFLYILVLPYLMLIFESLTFFAFKKRNENLYKSKIVNIDGKKIVAQGEIELENLKADYKEKSDLNKQIQILKDSLNLKETEINHLQENLLDSNNKIVNLENYVIGKDEEIRKIRSESQELVNNNRRFLREFSNTPRNTITEFINFFPFINDFSLVGSEKEKRAISIDRFIALGLLRISTDQYRINGKEAEYLEITEKGLFFVQKAFEKKYA